MYPSHPTIQLLGIVVGEGQKSYIEPMCHQLMQRAAVLKYLFERFTYCFLISYVNVDSAVESVTVFIMHEKYVAFHLM
jgi:hypothetical protein